MFKLLCIVGIGLAIPAIAVAVPLDMVEASVSPTSLSIPAEGALHGATGVHCYREGPYTGSRGIIRYARNIRDVEQDIPFWRAIQRGNVRNEF